MIPPPDFKQNLTDLLPRLSRYARNLTATQSDADDLLQSCCERALSRWQQFKPGTGFDRWMFTIMSSIRKNHLRAESVRQGQGIVNADTLPVSSYDTPEGNKFLHDVFHQVSALPVAQRQVMLLVYVEGYSYQDTADILGLPVGTVMSRIARARAKLHTQFNQSTSTRDATQHTSAKL